MRPSCKDGLMLIPSFKDGLMLRPSFKDGTDVDSTC